jgi:flagellar biosynthesis protein FlhB
MLRLFNINAPHLRERAMKNLVLWLWLMLVIGIAGVMAHDYQMAQGQYQEELRMDLAEGAQR